MSKESQKNTPDKNITTIVDSGLVYSMIKSLATHKTAHTMLMLLMLVGGWMALSQIHTRFFPDLRLAMAYVQVTWAGASAEAVEKQILDRLEPSIRALPDIHTVRGIATDHSGYILVEYDFGTNISSAIDDLKKAVDDAPLLPEEADKPTISQINFFDPVTNILITGDDYSEKAMNFYGRQLRDELFLVGVTSVKFHGLREREIVVNVVPENLERYGISWSDLSFALRNNSRQFPAGTLKNNDYQRKVLVDIPQVTPEIIRAMPLRTTLDGDVLTIGDVAEVMYEYKDGDLSYYSKGRNALLLEVGRSGSSDTLVLLDKVKAVLSEYQKTLPPTLDITLHQPAGELVKQRLSLLANNGLIGFVLVLIILFIFLNARVAFWVALGIPASLLATFVAMIMMGQTLNMITMFALIMTIGIVVDDAIVVGEHAMSMKEQGMTAENASINGAYAMIKPVTISMLTTVFSFTPIFFIGGIMGQILTAIPMVVIAVLICSFFECFLVLPGHLLKTFKKPLSSHRKGFIARNLKAFIDGSFQRWVRNSYKQRYVTAAWLLGIFILLGITPLAAGYVKFNFFPSPEGESIFVDVLFLPEVSDDTVKQGLFDIEKAAFQTQEDFISANPEKKIIKNSIVIAGGFTRLNSGAGRSSKTVKSGQILLELRPGEERDVRNKEFLDHWRSILPTIAGLSRVTFTEETSGPPGEGVNLTLKGKNIQHLEQAALLIQERLSVIPGLADVGNSFSDGQEEIVLTLNQFGIAAGLYPQSAGSQIRMTLQGEETMHIVDGEDEITVRLQQASPKSLDDISIVSPIGENIYLSTITNQKTQTRYGSIEHLDGLKQVTVTASIDTSITVLSEIMAEIASTIKEATQQYNVSLVLAGKGKDEAETLDDMKTGLIVGFLSMLVTLCWAFGKYIRPILIMLIIPFGVVGCVIWHMMLGFDMTIISLIALLGLAGILVNGSIILTMQADRLVEKGYSLEEALVRACKERFRPILITTITTIAGLLPMLFEASLQAKFLKPIAITLSGGMMASLLFLFFLVPCSIGIFEDISLAISRYKNNIIASLPSKKSVFQYFDGKMFWPVNVLKKGIKKLQQWTSQDDRQA